MVGPELKFCFCLPFHYYAVVLDLSYGRARVKILFVCPFTTMLWCWICHMVGPELKSCLFALSLLCCGDGSAIW